MAKNNFEPRHKFETWTRKFGGTEKLALELGVTQKCVQHWLSGRSSPRLHVANQVLKLAKRKLTLTDIYFRK